MNEVIKVVQLPVIAYDALKKIGAEVSERIEALNLAGQVVTEDTIKALKGLRTNLTKELKEYEDQRKAVKSAVNEPYSKFETEYKSEISEKYDSGIKTLKTKIDKYEIELKKRKENELKIYFEELNKVEGLEWFTWDRLNIQINLSDTLTAFKKQISEVVSKVVDDLKLINSEVFAAEMLTEYKRSLNASQAITTVRERKEAIRMEEERKKFETIKKRELLLHNFPMVSNTLTKTHNYIYDENIFLKWSDLELPQEEWIIKYVEVQAKIAQHKESQQPKESLQPKNEEAPIVQAPVIEQPKITEQTVQAEFRVTATMSKLKMLAQFMKDNQIEYENI